jgi:hypothetical protein
MPTSEPDRTGVSTREAAAILGTSVSDVLRRIKAGTLRAEKHQRHGGTYFEVFLDPPQPTPEPRQPIEEAPTPEPRQDVAEIVRQAQEPLSVALAAERERNDKLVTENATLRERAVAAETRASMLAEQFAAERAERERQRPWWRFWK